MRQVSLFSMSEISLDSASYSEKSYHSHEKQNNDFQAADENIA